MRFEKKIHWDAGPGNAKPTGHTYWIRNPVKTKPHTIRPRVRASELAGYRKAYKKFDADAKQYGLEVAIYNAGFIRGTDNGWEESALAVMPALRMLGVALASHKHKWTPKQRRAYEVACAHCDRGLKRKCA